MKKIVIKLLSTVAAFSLMSSIIPALPTNAVDTETKLIALTFDDGPGPRTSEILDQLKKYNAHAINAESAVSVKRAYDMGMEIDNHSKTHSNMSKMSADELQAEISDVDEKVKEITGEETKFFRPPFIDVSQSMYDNISHPFICGIDPRDYMENISVIQVLPCIL